MLERLRKQEGGRTGRNEPDRGAVEAGDERGGARDRVDGPDRDPGRDDHPRGGVASAAGPSVRARQREEFGGFNIGAAFFGWLVAVGLSALLIALVSAAGGAVGLSKTPAPNAASAGAVNTISLISGIALLIVLLIAYFAGGYVAGRLARFDGARNGIGAWAIGLLVTLALAAAGALLGAQYNLLAKLNLPRIPVNEGTIATGGLIALAAIILGTLLAAIIGGKAGERYHKKIDRAGGLAV